MKVVTILILLLVGFIVGCLYMAGSLRYKVLELTKMREEAIKATEEALEAIEKLERLRAE